MKIGIYVLLSAAFAVCVFLFGPGCVTSGEPRIERPAEYRTVVDAVKGWQDSGVSVKAHQVVSCRADGKWGYENELYSPDGDPRNIKEHHGVQAPTFGLIMKLSGSTNYFYMIGSYTNVSAPIRGRLYFRNNISLPDGVQGEVDVDLKVAYDTDCDGVSDYEEVLIWNTDPLRADTDGSGFTDLEKIEYRRQVQRERKGRVMESATDE